MLRLARRLREASQADLSKATGVDQGTISKYEGSICVMTNDHIALFSKALRLPTAFFFREGKMYGVKY